MYCKYCGKEIANDSKFCCHCGMQVNELAKSSDIQLNTEKEQLSPAVSIEDKKTIKVLTENNKALELRVKNLTFKTENQEELISDLKQDNFNLKYRLQQLEDFFKKLINLFKRMIKKDSKKETYLEVLEDMQDYRIISNNTIDEILKNKNNVKEKDDFER